MLTLMQCAKVTWQARATRLKYCWVLNKTSRAMWFFFFSVFLEPVPIFYLSQENKCEHHLYPFNFIFLASIPKGLQFNQLRSQQLLYQWRHCDSPILALSISHKLWPEKPFLEAKTHSDPSDVLSLVCLLRESCPPGLVPSTLGWDCWGQGRPPRYLGCWVEPAGI